MKQLSKQTAACIDDVSIRSSRITRLISVWVGTLLCLLLGNPGHGFGAVLPPTYSLTLAWNPSASPGVVSYNVYYGTASGNYSSSVTAANTTALTIPGLLSGVTYYFATTAVDANGLESRYSNEISYQRVISATHLQINAVPGGRFLLTVTGPAGHTNHIEATQDLKTWTIIGTVTTGVGGSVNFTDTNAASSLKKFYRTRETP